MELNLINNNLHRKKYLACFNSLLRKNNGQTTVEYMLLILSVVLISVTLFKNLSAYLLDNPNSLIRLQLDQAGLIFSNDQKRNRYRTLPYRLPKP